MGPRAGGQGRGDSDGDQAPGEPEPARLLLVDDTPESVRLIKGILEAQGFVVQAVRSGEDALERVRSDPPDLVLLDLIMPGLDGHEVCRRIRADPPGRFLPVVMLTAAGREQRARAIDAGADDFLTKPVERAELLARVRSLLRIKRYHDQIEAQSSELAALNRDLERRVSEQVEQMARLSRLRRFFPPKVADLVTTAGEAWFLDTHRSEVAVLFADLRGFTAFAHAAEPEEVMSVLRRFHQAAGECVKRREATVGWFSGDGIMVFLNDPVPCPDHATAAAHLAIEIRASVEVLLEQWREEGYDLGLGIGIAGGFATIGMLGVEERVEYSAVGSVVNLAARLCDRAQDGEILLSQSIRSAIGGAMGGEQLEGLALQGFPSPVTAWRLLDLGVVVGDGERAPAAAVGTAGRARGRVGPHENVFRQEGEDWTLAYRGRATRIRDAKGLGYLARLMANPGREVHVADLAGLTLPEAVLRSEAGRVIDSRARSAYQLRISELESERDQARDWGDLERSARADYEIAFLTQELSAAYGIGGRARRSEDPAERLRKAVGNRIRQTLGKLDGLHPELARHLANSVRTGTFCSYSPESEVEWIL